MEAINLQFTIQELQLVLQALGNLPYIQVQELIEKIKNQATPQLRDIKEAQKSSDVPEK